MVLSGYAPGTLCWAKLKGYPWWPSRIEDEDGLTEDVLDSKPRSGRVYPVLFFGSLDYAWMTPENLEPYEDNLTKHGSKAKNRKDPSFSDALKQAQDPSLLEELIRRNADRAAAASDSDDASDKDDDRDEDDDDEEEGARRTDSDGDVDMPSGGSDSTRASKQGRRGAGNGRTAQLAASRKRMSLNSNTSGDDAAPEATPKRSRRAQAGGAAAKGVSPGSATRRDSDDAQSAARSGPPSSRQSPERNGDKPAAPEAGRDEDGKAGRGAKAHPATKSGSKTYQFLMHLRHKLQKTVIKGPIPDDLAPVDEVLRRLEDFEMSLELIQGTKLGKVMRIIAESDRLRDPPDERFDIKGRASRLADKWRQLIFKQRGELAEGAAPESPASKTAQPNPQRAAEAEGAAPDGGAGRSESPPQSAASAGTGGASEAAQS